ncbi:MAG: nucleotide exchange factor GrpE [Firmicutes bacterium]|nr:nucleotide exchange factor GrpE [[Eubacterium] siraeum]MCM1488768.1 nucleotide exchange factor GrpE [Bacillota bacterium]
MSKKNKEEKEEKEEVSGEIPENETDAVPAEAEAEEAPEGDSPQEELKKKDEEIEKLKDQLMRNMAEYDNYRKRTARERVELEPEITAKTVSEFLAVADNLERALSSECTDENYKKGVQMIYDSFMETLNKLGVEQIPAEGSFDPTMHQAVQQMPAAEGQESGQIAATFQKGYKLGSRILRFAMVAVVA